MFNKFTKMLLVGTSLAPTLLIMAVDYFSRNDFTWTFSFGFQLLTIACLLVFISVAIMWYIKTNGSRITLKVCKAKSTDKEVLAFLLAYLLPVLSKHEYLFSSFNFPTLSILLLMAVAVYHSNAFDFNPLLGILGYHFYEVEGDDSFPYLLISRHPIIKPCRDLRVIQIFDYTFLAVET